MKKITIALAVVALLAGCVATSKLKQSQAETAALRNDSARLANSNTDLEGNIAQLNKSISGLKEQNAGLLDQNQFTLQQQQQRLKHLQDLLAQQRAASAELKNKMTEALEGFSANDLTVTEKNGKVYVSLSENLLFPSGSAVVNAKGANALAKLAAVLNLNTDVAINIEGHTDSIPIRGRYQDNWDLSTSRADAIVRILVNNYKVDPMMVEASGHSKYDPIDTNTTPDGRAKNRRTEIILSPKLDEMYKLLAS